ncbi:MAG: acyl-CoA dehydrogenase [Actinobacteria bacterium]|nr:acyl-CoA dehydrogenase [Actinomycetota bacterium]
MSYAFDHDPAVKEFALRVRNFVNSEVIPHEPELNPNSHGINPDLRLVLQDKARAAEVFAPTAPKEFGGHGFNHVAQAVILEESGRSLLGPTALNCAAPDEGNILLGEIRSSFSMTEPSPGAGADPNLLSTTAQRTGNGWVLNGNKWLITGADGAGFSIVMAKTSGGATMFLVDASNPGMKVVRSLDTLDSAFTGGHGVVDFTNCEVSEDAVLGQVDEGFVNAQVRLGPARLTHCMRWLGAARRAHESAVEYAAQRPMFGTELASLGMAQQMIADNEIDIAACRALVHRAAWVLDQGLPARAETSIAKTFVAEATFRIVDRSMQLCGAKGTSSELPIAQIFRDIRPFRIYDGPSEVHRWSISRRSVRHSQAGKLPGDWA